MDEARPLIRIVRGSLLGVIEESISGKRYAAFKGIPYAKPPIGELRFRDPAPAEPWSFVKDASEFGTKCAQFDPLTRSLTGSEDCLYLNVYTPYLETPRSPAKPVMFWIHGGGFSHGCGDDTAYGPDYIIDRDVVLVTMNYRLNVLGFLNTEDEEASGNQGLKDQLLALKWVRENIADFGGDPTNVTIFGESAGSSSVHYLTLSPLAKGLFHKAISQSGVAINPWAWAEASPKRYAQKLAKILGQDISDSKILVQFLRTIDARELARAELRLFAESRLSLYRPFGPTIDAKSKNPFFPIPLEIASRAGVGVPYMMGYTSHEAILFMAGLADKHFNIMNARFERVFSPAMMRLLAARRLKALDLKKLYFSDEPVSRDTLDNYMRMQSDVQFVAGIHEIAAIQAATNEAPTYLYKFSYDNGKSLVKAHFGLDMPGACHSDDLSYIFCPKILKVLGLSPAEANSTDSLVIERVTEMWTNFAKTGNPTPVVSSTLPVKWEALTHPEDLRCLNIGEDLCMESVTNVNKYWAKKTTSKL